MLTSSALVSALLTGQKIPAISLISRTFVRNERRWRHDHEFKGDTNARLGLALIFYDATHQKPLYRALRIGSVPAMLGGGLGLFLFRPWLPFWHASAATFIGGVAMHVGAKVVDPEGPSFAEDPVAFFAGPIWDMVHLIRYQSTFSPNDPRSRMSMMGLSPELVH